MSRAYIPYPHRLAAPEDAIARVSETESVMGMILESTPAMGEYGVEVRRESFYLRGASMTNNATRSIYIRARIPTDRRAPLKSSLRTSPKYAPR